MRKTPKAGPRRGARRSRQRGLAAASAAAAGLLGPQAAGAVTLVPIGDTIGPPVLPDESPSGYLDYASYDLDGDGFFDFSFYWTGSDVEVYGESHYGQDPDTYYYGTFYNTVAGQFTSEVGILAIPIGFDTQVDVTISTLGGGSGGYGLIGSLFTLGGGSGYGGFTSARISSLAGFDADSPFLAAHFFNGFDPGGGEPMAFFELQVNPDASVTLLQGGFEDGSSITMPVPEPSSLTLIALGAAGLGAWRRRQAR